MNIDSIKILIYNYITIRQYIYIYLYIFAIMSVVSVSVEGFYLPSLSFRELNNLKLKGFLNNIMISQASTIMTENLLQINL